MLNKTSNFSPIIFALILVIGIWLGKSLSFGDFSKSEVNKFNLILDQLEEAYVDSIDREELIEKAVTNLLKELDPHSYYIKAKDFSAINEPMEGSFDGIGVEFNLLDDTILVVAPISGGPSQRVGIQSGDKIVSVDGEVIAGTDLENEDVFKLLRGKSGTKVTVGVLRRGEDNLIDFEITRDKIPIYSVDVSYMIDDETAYIKINRFSANTYEEFVSASEKLLDLGMKKLILDLRNNPGGYLGAAINIANEFLEDNLLIVYTQDRYSKRQEYYSNARGLLLDIEAVVIIDEGSASASEIVAGALQDNDKGTIVGRRSFGKGLVQEQFEHPDGSAYRITTQRYHTPTGRCIQRPYAKGQEDDYEDDFINRMNNGELLSKDSIVFNDSLKFVTKGGKIVYGGGGIMPDVFVPLDTTSYHSSISTANRKDLIRQYAFDYTSKHREELETQSLQDFIQLFEVNTDDLKALSTYCKASDVDMPINEFSDYDTKIITSQLKAHIARNIWNDDGFFPIIHEIDYTFQQAKLQ
ncbi:MAG: S41 family peptidase [Flavobacteriales bacterium]|nr:S41 family peptidase [Flavobacteriales bacterium]